MDLRSVLLFATRTFWVVLAFLTQNDVAAFATHGGSPGTILATGAIWALWLVSFVALLVPTTYSLTLTRITIPATAAVYLLAASDFYVGAAKFALVVAIGILIIVHVFSAHYGDLMVNGSSYGSERRLALKPPTFVLATALIPIGVGIVTAICTSIYFVRFSEPIGYALFGGTIALVPFGYRIMNQFSRRWLVFVPAGFVMHDPFLLDHSVLFRRNVLSRLTTTTDEMATNDTIDLTGGTTGFSSSVSTVEPVRLDLRNEAEPVEATRITVAPSLPGEVLKEARIRGVKTQVSN